MRPDDHGKDDTLIASGCGTGDGAVLVPVVEVSWPQDWTSQAEGGEAQRQVQKHGMLKARSVKIRIPPHKGLGSEPERGT